MQEHDHLYRALMQGLYNDWSGHRDDKAEWLLRLQNDGFGLIDLSDRPLPSSAKTTAAKKRALEPFVKDRVEEIKRLAPSVGVVLVASAVWSLLTKPLTDQGITVINHEMLPFPSSGQQGRFAEGFSLIQRHLV